MNKKLIAAAVAAGLAAPMAAQADATWYGQLQMEVTGHSSDFADEDAAFGSGDLDGHVWQSTGRWNADDTRLEDDKRGRLGVKGDEDLGGGLKAIYKFEFQVDTSTADVDDGDRNSFVGLKGNWGAVKLGSLKSPYKYFGGVKYDPFVTTSAEARRYGGMTSGQFGSNGFVQNAVSYQNKFGMANLWITYVPDERSNRDGDYFAGLKFSQKSWEAFIAAAHDNDTNNTADDGDDPNFDAIKVGGQWRKGPHKLSAQYESTTDEVPGGDDIEGTVIYVNYDLKMGKNIFTATYGMPEVEQGSDKADGTYMRVGMTHKFSKKTRFMLAYMDSEIDPDGIDAQSKSALTAALRVDF